MKVGMVAWCVYWSVVLIAGVGRVGNCEEEAAASRRLVVLVPRKVGFEQFASVWCPSGGDNSTCAFSGFAVEVFETCIKRLSRPILFDFVVPGDDASHPSYDAMIEVLKNKEVDGVVGDFTILAKRMKEVDFTHPYIQSTLVMMVPYASSTTKSRQLWNFLQPFSVELWGSIAALFVSTCLVIFVLEHENPQFHVPGLDWKARLANVFWFTSMTLFFSQKADISTRLGRLLTMSWLLVVLIFTSSYTASLTSILSTQLPIPTIGNFQELQKSNLSIGYQDGSFVKDYVESYLNIKPERLQMLATEENYEESLNTGKVAAILDELPYIQTFLNTQCKYTKSGPQIAYFGGFGFAFQKNSSLTNELSLEIVKLEQNGELQGIRDRWLGVSTTCGSTVSADTYIPLKDFGGLFIIVATLYTFCILLRFLGWILHFYHNQKKDQVAPA